MDYLYMAADMDNDGMMEFYEFMCLYKYIEEVDDPYAIRDAERKFFFKCDLVSNENGEKCLSQERFRSLAIENGWFRKRKVDKFCEDIL